MTPPPNTDVCKAMKSVRDQLYTQLSILTADIPDTITCTLSKSCEEVECSSSGGKLSIIRSCSPIGMTLKFVNTSKPHSEPNSQLFKKSGVFMDYYQVTVDQKKSGFDFALNFHLEIDNNTVFDRPLVNKTFIPTTSCGGDTSGLSSEFHIPEIS